jgi:uncharacterized protein YgiM (DUF1202 family)
LQNQKASHKPLVYKGTTLLLSTGFILYSGDTSLKLLDTIKAEASSVTYYETTSNLNLRVSNSTKSTVLLTIPKGEKISYLSKSGSWFKVKFNNRTGWVNNKYVKKAENITSSKAIVSGYQTTANLNLRSKASTNGEILKTIPKGKTLTYISTSGSWIKVKYQTTTGWVSSDYVKKVNEKAKVEPATVVKSAVVTSNSLAYTTKANLNLRSSASTKGSILTTIPKGKSVTYVSKSGSWFKVKYGGKTGWVSSSYLKATSTAAKPTNGTGTPSTVAKPQQEVNYQATANLNLRSSSSTKGSILTTIPKGKSVTYISKSGSWFKVKYSGKTGWVSSSYLKGATPNKNESPSPSVEKPKANLTYQTTARLNLRTEASTQGSVLTLIPKGEKVTYLSKNSFWFKVKYGNKTGWVSSEFLKETTEDKKEEVKDKEIYTTTANLKFRNSGSPSGTVITTIPKGKQVTYLSKKGSWYKVTFNSLTGWVSSSYLVKGASSDSSNPISSDSYVTMDLRTKSSVTAAQINAYIAKNATSSNSVLYNRGSIFIDAANKYGVNALYLAAHAIHESNFGKSTISLAKNNLFGYGAYDAAPFVGAVKFNTIKSNIEFIAQMMKATYLNEGYWSYKGAYLGSTVKDSKGNRIDSLSSGMNFYYATDSNWGKAIAKHMSVMLDYSNEGAKNATPNKTVPSRPSYPDAKDVFPTGTLAVAHKTINLTSADNTGSSVYKTTSNLNLRSSASTKGSILLTIPNGKTITYLSASGSWYKVQYNGKTGWVSSEYVTKTNSGSTVSIQAGETFNLLEKHNNESLKIKYKGKMYYTSSFGLSSYYNYMSVKNLARVDATSLNVRSAANTGSSVVGILSNYQYIELSVDSKNNPVTSNGWYKVKLSNGTQGWVSGMHIIRELNK